MQPLPLSDAVVAQLPVHDLREPLLDVRTVGALRVDPRLADVNPDHAKLRISVVDRLVVAQSLLPRGLRLLLIEGYRSPALQERHLRDCSAAIHGAHPDWSRAQVEHELAWYCSPAGPAPHPTGAAADLTLCTEDGTELPMGTGVHQYRADGTSATNHPDVDAVAAANRANLSRALSASGMVNLAAAWWHWSFGDRYWCHLTGAKAAPYGPVEI